MSTIDKQLLQSRNTFYEEYTIFVSSDSQSILLQSTKGLLEYNIGDEIFINNQLYEIVDKLIDGHANTKKINDSIYASCEFSWTSLVMRQFVVCKKP